jgi:hypothetical protein
MICRIGGHEAAPAQTYNGGFHFGHCRRCGNGMIRRGGGWESVPKGHKVVWTAGWHAPHSIEADYAAVLPVLHRDSNLPAVRRPSLGRQLVRLATCGRRTAQADPAAAAKARAGADYPSLLVVAALLGAGLQLLLGAGARRLV